MQDMRQKKLPLGLKNSDIDITINLKSTTLNIIEIVGDVAEFRKTPVSWYSKN